MSETPEAFSFKRLFLMLVPVAIVAGAVGYSLPGYQRQAQEKLEASILAGLLGKGAQPLADTIEFADADGDLLADPPADEACVAPETLAFSYIGSPDESDAAPTWADMTVALTEATGLSCEYRSFESLNDQIAAMVAGQLHVVGVNSGAVPTAVVAAGFHPVVTFGRSDGTFGYTMQILAPKQGVADAAGLSGKRVAFTSPASNSGFKAALAYLLDEHGMRPERDYQWSWTYSHASSIKAVAAGEQDAAPIASDILERMVNNGEVEADAVKVLYESERFPPATIGFVYNLTPTLREQITNALTGFAWGDSSVAAKYTASGAEGFVPVNYKDDWANIRRINEAVAAARN